MYELAKESHLQELVGQEVNLIGVGPYDAQVHFDGGTVIQALHLLEGEVDGIRSLWFDGEWVNTEALRHLPLQQVVSVCNESPLTLKVALTGGVSLFFHTEISPYESINITRADGSLEVI